MSSETMSKTNVVGVKQSRRAIIDGKAKVAYIAGDSDDHIRLPLVSLCEEHGVQIVHFSTMTELGAAFGIEVGAAVAVLLKPES